jgi:predicted deacetylase
MIPTPAQYLLRFDDLCPTVSAEPWMRLEALVVEFGLKPILAVVPDNRDPELQLSKPDKDFWVRMQALEFRGSMIGLHGYQHLCQSREPGIAGWHQTTEFAGVDAATQREWIAEGLRILRGHGLNPRIWVAPRHGFDEHTLEALQGEGIELVSDGFARHAFLQGGLTWIPQQLWSPIEKPRGLWTICLHPNTATGAEIDVLTEFLRSHAQQFTSVDETLARFPAAELSTAEKIYAGIALRRRRYSQAKNVTGG